VNYSSDVTVGHLRPICPIPRACTDGDGFSRSCHYDERVFRASSVWRSTAASMAVVGNDRSRTRSGFNHAPTSSRRYQLCPRDTAI